MQDNIRMKLDNLYNIYDRYGELSKKRDGINYKINHRVKQIEADIIVLEEVSNNVLDAKRWEDLFKEDSKELGG